MKALFPFFFREWEEAGVIQDCVALSRVVSRSTSANVQISVKVSRCFSWTKRGTRGVTGASERD